MAKFVLLFPFLVQTESPLFGRVEVALFTIFFEVQTLGKEKNDTLINECGHFVFGEIVLYPNFESKKYSLEV